MALSQGRRRMIGRLNSRKTREREGRVLVEGVRAVGEALGAGARAHFALTTRRLGEAPGGAALLEALSGAGIETLEVGDDELAELSDTEHPQGVLLVVDEPAHDLASVAAGARLLVLDRVQDPGNLGTLVRAAVAFALDGVIALDGTTDPWGSKSVRASAGTVFRIPLLGRRWSEVEVALERTDLPLWVAAADGEPLGDGRRGGRFALALGNEGAGVRDAVRRAALEVVSVPMPGGAESLNVAMAGTVLMYALTREL